MVDSRSARAVDDLGGDPDLQCRGAWHLQHRHRGYCDAVPGITQRGGFRCGPLNLVWRTSSNSWWCRRIGRDYDCSGNWLGNLRGLPSPRAGHASPSWSSRSSARQFLVTSRQPRPGFRERRARPSHRDRGPPRRVPRLLAERGSPRPTPAIVLLARLSWRGPAGRQPVAHSEPSEDRGSERVVAFYDQAARPTTRGSRSLVMLAQSSPSSRCPTRQGHGSGRGTPSRTRTPTALKVPRVAEPPRLDTLAPHSSPRTVGTNCRVDHEPPADEHRARRWRRGPDRCSTPADVTGTQPNAIASAITFGNPSDAVGGSNTCPLARCCSSDLTRQPSVETHPDWPVAGDPFLHPGPQRPVTDEVQRVTSSPRVRSANTVSTHVCTLRLLEPTGEHHPATVRPRFAARGLAPRWISAAVSVGLSKVWTQCGWSGHRPFTVTAARARPRRNHHRCSR